MIQIGKAIVSPDIFEQMFVCDLAQCKGACCVEGDSGAPLTDNEAVLLERLLPEIQPYLTTTGWHEIEKQGAFVIDSDNDKVTPLVGIAECVYVRFEHGVAKCAIEAAFLAGRIGFRKPVSCHLYPVRIHAYNDFEAVNYDRWDICKAALALGKAEGVPVYRFVKDALIRKYGQEWYDVLEIAAKQYEEYKKA